MSKKDYEKAATIIQRERSIGDNEKACLVSTFVEFFSADNPAFNEVRFRKACVPGANVKAGRAKVA